MALPANLDVVVAASKAYVKIHRFCKAREAKET